jgi:hypothetical protein
MSYTGSTIRDAEQSPGTDHLRHVARMMGR